MKSKTSNAPNTPTNLWKRFWYYFWKDDTIWGWIFSFAVIIILIKFVFFPFLNFATGTALPLAIVESCSMYHEGDLFSNPNKWYDAHESKYEQFDISKEQFSEFKFKKGFNKGDILFVFGTKPEKLKVGDTIIFQASQTTPVIHRIIEIKEEDGERIFSTMGDNNNGQLPFEKNIKEEQIIGRASLRLIPYLGWGKLIFFEFTKPKEQRGFCRGN